MQTVRDDREYWQDVETQVAQRQGPALSHGIRPDGDERGMAPQLRAVGIEPTRPQEPAGRPRVAGAAPAGAWTIEVSGVDGRTGVVLVEIYDLGS